MTLILQASGLEKGRSGAHICGLTRKDQPMASIFIKIALGTGLAILSVYPGKGLRGAIIIIALVIAAAFVLHFVAP
ncbi:MAG TPA: hypothetical protein VGO54_16640 [Bradyrhizobium sp.]|nr:hypothetical protein [Bradyrhizobium sp.]